MFRFFLLLLLLLLLLVWSLRAVLRSRGATALENLALRQQLATYARGRKRPRSVPKLAAAVHAASRW